MSRFDDLRHRVWVGGRRRYGGESFRGDTWAEFPEEMLDGADYADQAVRDDRRWWIGPACWAQYEACGGSWPARPFATADPAERRRLTTRKEPGA